MAEGTGPGERIGRRLRDVREAGLWTRNELAAKSGVSPGAIEDLEIGKVTRPRRTTIDKLAKALGIEPETLMYGTESDDDPLGAAVPSSPRDSSEPQRPGSLRPSEAGSEADRVFAADEIDWNKAERAYAAGAEMRRILAEVEAGERSADEAAPAITDAVIAMLKAGGGRMAAT